MQHKKLKGQISNSQLSDHFLLWRCIRHQGQQQPGMYFMKKNNASKEVRLKDPPSRILQHRLTALAHRV